MIIEDVILERCGGRNFLSLLLSDLKGVDPFMENFEAGEYEIKRIHTKRSLNANAFMWKICEEIAFHLAGMHTKEEVYQNAIRNVGVYYPLEMDAAAADSFVERWAENGIGWVADIVDWAGEDKKLVYAYTGSSTYTKVEMQRLIDYLVEDAKAMELEIAQDPRIESLCANWKPKYQ